MNKNKLVTFQITIPESHAEYFYKLEKKHNSDELNCCLKIEDIISGAVCVFVEKIEQEEINFKTEDENIIFLMN